MKKIKVLFGMLASLAMIVGMSSCSKDDDNSSSGSSSENHASIIGSWGCVRSTETCQNKGENPETFENTLFSKTLIFRDDLTYSFSARTHDKYHYALRNNGSWMKDGSVLYVNNGTQKDVSQVWEWKIQQLTEDKLVLYTKSYFSKYNYNYIFFNEPENWDYYYEALLEFKRQS